MVCFVFTRERNDLILILIGNLFGTANLSFSRCASIKANSVSLGAGSRIDIDMAGLSGLVDNYYYGPLLYVFSLAHEMIILLHNLILRRIRNFTSGGAGATKVNTYGVYSPSQQLCSQLVGTATHTYVRFFACDANTSIHLISLLLSFVVSHLNRSCSSSNSACWDSS